MRRRRRFHERWDRLGLAAHAVAGSEECGPGGLEENVVLMEPSPTSDRAGRVFVNLGAIACSTYFLWSRRRRNVVLFVLCAVPAGLFGTLGPFLADPAWTINCIFGRVS